MVGDYLNGQLLKHAFERETQDQPRNVATVKMRAITIN